MGPDPGPLSRTLRGVLFGCFALVIAFPAIAAIVALSALFTVGDLSALDSGGNTPLSRLIISCLVLLGATAALLIPVGPRVPRPLALGLTALIAAWGAAAAFSVAPADSWLDWTGLATAALFFFVAVSACDTPARTHLGVDLFLGAAVLSSFVAIAMYGMGGDPHAALSGTFYQADVAAGYLLLAVPLALSRAIAAADWSPRVMYGTVTITLGMQLVLTYSRGGLLSVLVACAVLALWHYSITRSARRALALPVVLALLVVLFSAAVTSSGKPQIIPRRALERAATLGAQDTSVLARLAFWRGALLMVRDRPALGWGPGTYGRVFPRYQTDVRWYSKYAHSEYLALASEGGLLTILGFLAFVGTLARTLAPGLRDPVVAGIAASLLAVLGHLVLDVDWEFPILTLTWFGLAGIAVARVRADEGPRGAWRFAATVPLLAALALLPRPYAAHLHAEEARALRATGKNPEAAVHEAAAAAERMPFSAEYHRLHAEVLTDAAHAGDRTAAPQAVEQARRAVALDPYRAVNHEALASAFVVNGDSESARQSAMDALSCDPLNYPNLYNLLAELTLRAGQPDEAVRILEMPASAYPPDTFRDMWFFRRDAIQEQLLRTFLLLGRLQQQRGRAPQAIEAYRRAADLDPQNIVARFQLGSILMEAGRPGEAWVHFREIHAMKPEHPISQWLLGLAYRELGQAARAEELLVKASRAMPALASSKNLRIPADFFSQPRTHPERSPR